MRSLRFSQHRPAALGLLALLSALPVALPAQNRHGIDVTLLDRTVKPDEDFYRYANGKWLTKTKLPDDKPAIGTFEEIQERNDAVLHSILEKAAKEKNAPTGSIARKVGDFYCTGMDEKKADLLGAKPLQPYFEQINAVPDSGGLLEEIARLHRIGAAPAFGISIGQDDKNSSQIIVQIGQGGLGMPDRDYYLKDDAKTKEVRTAYLAHVTRTFLLLGETPADAKSDTDTILRIETRLAKASMDRVAMRDPNAIYHKMTLSELEAATPGTEWNRYFGTLGIADPGGMNIAQPEFLKEFSTMLTEVPLAQWKPYLRWNVVRAFSSYLSRPFVDENFQYGAALTGQKKMAPRWRRVMGVTDGALGEAAGQLFVAQSFPPAAKQRALELVLNLKAALRERIQTLEWMGEATKVQATRKLDAMKIKIGYPDKWRDYSGLTVGTDSFVQNVIRSNTFDFAYRINKLGKPVDRTEWGMTPPTVNAYYNPNMNEIVFPAGILQPPFFDAKADDASNYGAIGAVIGHEMTHGFDDQGRQYDAEGNLKDWWTAEDAKRFTERSSALVTQYGGYVAVDDVHVNGALTTGENIADLGGLKIAYLAFKKAQAAHPQPARKDGFTPNQRFFLAFAQAWRFKTTPKIERLIAQLDPHSPPRWRVLGTLYNMPAFADAFGAGDAQSVVKLGAGRVDIW